MTTKRQKEEIENIIRSAQRRFSIEFAQDELGEDTKKALANLVASEMVARIIIGDKRLVEICAEERKEAKGELNARDFAKGLNAPTPATDRQPIGKVVEKAKGVFRNGKARKNW